MANFFLPVILDNCFTNIEGWINRLDQVPEYEGVLHLCEQFRTLGICYLFLEYDAAAALTMFHASGRAFVHYAPSIPDDAYVTSWNEALFDAIASGDDRTAAQMAQLSSPTVKPTHEYEEDFLYHQFIYDLFYRSRPEEEVAALLEIYRNVTQGNPDPRLDVAEALLQRDGVAFAEAFSALIEQFERRYARMREAGTINDEKADTLGKLFVEGLALLRLADRRGIPTEPEYAYVPSLLRIDASAQFADDLWRQIA
jgi:hypothetical protein